HLLLWYLQRRPVHMGQTKKYALKPAGSTCTLTRKTMNTKIMLGLVTVVLTTALQANTQTVSAQPAIGTPAPQCTNCHCTLIAQIKAAIATAKAHDHTLRTNIKARTLEEDIAQKKSSNTLW